MNLSLTEEEALELLELVSIGNFVRSAVREAEGTFGPDDDALERMLYESAVEEGIVESIEEMSDEDALEIRRRSAERMIGDFIDDEFWYELDVRLAERDLDREPSETVQHYRDRYAQEFKTFGLDRLEVNPDAPVADLREVL